MRRTTRLLLWMAVTAAAAAAAFGCSPTTGPLVGGGGGNTGGNVAGTYALSAVGTSTLPATLLASGGDSLFVTDGSIVLGTTTYAFTANERVVTAGVSSTQAQGDTGTYTATDSTVAFTSTLDSSTTSGTLSGTTLTIANMVLGTNGITYTLVFTKQ